MQIVVENPASLDALETAFCAAIGLPRAEITFFLDLNHFIAAEGRWVDVFTLRGDFQFLVSEFSWTDAYDEDAVAKAMSGLLATRTAVIDDEILEKCRLYENNQSAGTLYLMYYDGEDDQDRFDIYKICQTP